MAHFAELDDNDVVIQVVTVDNDKLLDANGNEDEALGIAHLDRCLPGRRWVQCSYNATFRSIYPAIKTDEYPGDRWDPVAQVFIAAQETVA